MPDTQGLPWPKGDPGAARAAASRAAALAGSLRGLGTTVGTTDAPGWSGAAATAFDGAVQRDAAAVSGAAGAFDTAAGALTTLAGKLDTARERVLEAARRLREAREAAALAESRARDARSAATTAHANAALDPSSVFGSPLLAEAGAAEDSALRAESLSGAAQADLARVTRWAEHEAQDAVSDAERADANAAGELESASAAAAALGGGTGIPTAALAGGGAAAPMAAGGPLRHLGGYLGGDLFNYWAGGSDRETLPVGKLAVGGAFMYGTTKYLRAAGVASSWARVAPGGAGTLTAYAADLRTAALPTFNNGFLGKGVSRGLSAVPATRGAGSWMSNASKATPVFRRLGIAGGAFSTVMDGKHLIEQGNPVDAYKRDGAGYVADVGRTAFSASSTAFLIAPNPVTGGAVLVSGAVWAGAEAWDHREQIAGAVSSGAEWAWDHSAAGAVWNNREEIGAAVDSGIDTAQAFAGDVGDRLDSGIDTAADVGGEALDKGGEILDDITPDIDVTPW